MEASIHIRGLTKRIENKILVEQLDLDLYPGEILGLLGPNGAGKSTTLKLILGLMRKTSGEIRLGAYRDATDGAAIRAHIGAVVENPEPYPYMSAKQQLDLQAKLYPDVPAGRAEEMLRLVGLADTGKKKAGVFSLGMKQRLGIAAAMLRKPDFLILDEPTNGLDPEGIRQMREILLYLARQEGVGILVSSHILAEIQNLCDRVAIIDQGRLLRVDHVSQLLREHEAALAPTYQIELSGAPDLEAALQHAGCIFRVRRPAGTGTPVQSLQPTAQRRCLDIRVDARGPEWLLRLILDRNICLHRLELGHGGNLEDVFMEIIRRSRTAGPAKGGRP